MTMSFEDRVEQRYRADQGRFYHQSKRAVPEVAYPWIAALRARKIQPEVTVEDVVFEYGVGTGWNLAQLRCKRRIGFDLADHVEPILRQYGIEFVTDPARIGDGTIDVCLCHHVLEHVPNPPKVLADVARLLRAGGKLLLFVPYEHERRYHRYDPLEPNHHLYSWNVQTLANLVASAGFTVVRGEIGRFGYDRCAAVWATRRRLGATAYRGIQRAIHLTRPAYEVRIVARKDDSYIGVPSILGGT
jgi:SAM-dependent methyltransferase